MQHVIIPRSIENTFPFLKKQYLNSTTQLFYILGTFISFVGICHLSRIFFPEPYSIRFFTISHQGDPYSNPQGCWIFNTGVFLMGLLVIPYIVYLWKKFVVFLPKMAIITGVIHVLATLNVSLVGIFPMHFYPFHRIVAFLAFTCYLLSINLYLGMIIVRFSSLFFQTVHRILFGSYLVFPNLIYGILLLTWNNGKIKIAFRSHVIVLNFPLWEWLYFYCIFGSLILISFFFYRHADQISK